MAISTGTIFEVRSTGNDNNGGGFNSGGSSPGTDRSQQDAPHVTIDGSTITATVHTTTTQLTLVGHTVSAADNRNLIRITGGTATAGFYEITAIDAVNNRWTLDRAAGTAAQTAIGRMGGAWSTLANLTTTILPTTCEVWIKEGIYTTGALINGAIQRRNVYGYSTTRGDEGRPTIRASANIASIFDGWDVMRNLILEANGFTITNSLCHQFVTLAENIRTTAGARGFWPFDTRTKIVRCRAENHTTIGFYSGSTANQGHAILQSIAVGCAVGFDIDARVCVDCIAINCTTAGFRQNANAMNGSAIYCTAVGCGIGFSLTGNQLLSPLINCLAVNSTTYNFAFPTSGIRSGYLRNCGGYGAGTANMQGTPLDNINFVTIVNQPLADIAGGNYALNNTSQGGAIAKDIEFQWPDLVTTLTYRDIGAIESVLIASAIHMGIRMGLGMT